MTRSCSFKLFCTQCNASCTGLAPANDPEAWADDCVFCELDTGKRSFMEGFMIVEKEAL